jgi:hypothetical protein
MTASLTGCYCVCVIQTPKKKNRKTYQKMQHITNIFLFIILSRWLRDLGWMIGFSDVVFYNLLQSRSIRTAHKQWLPGLRLSSLLVFVLLWLIWFSVTNASVLVYVLLPTATAPVQVKVKVQSYLTTGGLPPISSSWSQALWVPPVFLNWTLAVILM